MRASAIPAAGHQPTDNSDLFVRIRTTAKFVEPVGWAMNVLGRCRIEAGETVAIRGERCVVLLRTRLVVGAGRVPRRC